MDDFFSNKPMTSPGYESSREYYPDEFIYKLAKDFGFKSPNIDLLTYIYEIAYPKTNFLNRIISNYNNM